MPKITKVTNGVVNANFKLKLLKNKASAEAEAFAFSAEIYFTTFTKIISSVNSTSDSMKANPRISAS